MSTDGTQAGVAAEIDWLRRISSAAQVAPEGFDIPRLLRRLARVVDAVEAVTGLAGDADAWAWESGPDGNRVPVRWDLDPEAVRQAITSALLGEDKVHG